MGDFAIWNPGETVICVICGHERGGDDPPGDWMRHRPSHRRRIPIWDASLPGVLGHLTFVRL